MLVSKKITTAGGEVTQTCLKRYKQNPKIQFSPVCQLNKGSLDPLLLFLNSSTTQALNWGFLSPYKIRRL